MYRLRQIFPRLSKWGQILRSVHRDEQVSARGSFTVFIFREVNTLVGFGCFLRLLTACTELDELPCLHPWCCPLWCQCPCGCPLPQPMSSGPAMTTDMYGLQQQNYPWSSQDECSKIYVSVCAMMKGEIWFALHWISPTSQQPNWKLNYSLRLIPKASPAGQQAQAAAQGVFLLGLRWWQSKRSAIKRKQINFPLLKLGEPCIRPCIK